MLFKSHFKGLVHFAQKYVKDFDTAKEIVQDSFISLWEKKDTIDLSKPVKSIDEALKLYKDLLGIAPSHEEIMPETKVYKCPW